MKFVKLTQFDDKAIHVNLGQALTVERFTDHTMITLAIPGRGDRPFQVQVKETPEQIWAIAARPTV
jgi:hypothetical protein